MSKIRRFGWPNQTRELWLYEDGSVTRVWEDGSTTDASHEWDREELERYAADTYDSMYEKSIVKRRFVTCTEDAITYELHADDTIWRFNTRINAHNKSLLSIRNMLDSSEFVEVPVKHSTPKPEPKFKLEKHQTTVYLLNGEVISSEEARELYDELHKVIHGVYPD